MRVVLTAFGFVSFGLGLLGVFVPVLPTTPFMLLAAFLFAKSSPRMDAWIKSTRVWQAYGAPFKKNGGISKRKKMHILGVSYLVMGLSAVLVARPFVWAILAAVALFLAWLMLVRIPTVEEDGIAGFVAPEVELEDLAATMLQTHTDGAKMSHDGKF